METGRFNRGCSQQQSAEMSIDRGQENRRLRGRWRESTRNKAAIGKALDRPSACSKEAPFDTASRSHPAHYARTALLSADGCPMGAAQHAAAVPEAKHERMPDRHGA